MDQAAGEGFHVAPGNGLHQQEFYDLVIPQSFRPTFDQPLAQPGPVAAGIVPRLRGAPIPGTRNPTGIRAGVFGGFIEETVVIGHNVHRQLPFPDAKRK